MYEFDVEVERVIALANFFAMHTDDDIQHPDYKLDTSKAIDFLTVWAELREELRRLTEDDLPSVTRATYELAKPVYGEDNKSLQLWFKHMNLVLFDKPFGPRLAHFISIFGIDRYIEKVDNRLNQYLSLFGV